MKKFLKNIVLFLIISIVFGEVIVRMTHAVSDIPQRTIDEYGIQKYLPNQEGYWRKGEHKWFINKLGWPGELPKSYDNLIMIIGDSFIENFMNPSECHQSSFLKKNMEKYNFMEIARSGVSLIEAMEISKQIDSFMPIQKLIYINNQDFYESIAEIKPKSDITQLSIKTNSINYGELKAGGFKKALYTWKLLYYLYNRFPLSNPINTKENDKDISNSKKKSDYINEISHLIKFIKNNYNIRNTTLVFHPNSDESIIKICSNAGFNIILLDSKNDDKWTFDYDSHWTCYGHRRAANQISNNLLNTIFQDTIR